MTSDFWASWCSTAVAVSAVSVVSVAQSHTDGPAGLSRASGRISGRRKTVIGFCTDIAGIATPTILNSFEFQEQESEFMICYVHMQLQIQLQSQTDD